MNTYTTVKGFQRPKYPCGLSEYVIVKDLANL